MRTFSDLLKFVTIGIGFVAITTAGCATSGNSVPELGISCDQAIPVDEIAVLSGTEIDTKVFDLCDPNVRAGFVSDITYLRAVNSEFVPFTDDDVAMKVGKGMCELIERAVLNGYSVRDAKITLKQQSDRAAVYTSNENSTIISAAVESYCPEYGAR